MQNSPAGTIPDAIYLTSGVLMLSRDPGSHNSDTVVVKDTHFQTRFEKNKRGGSNMVVFLCINSYCVISAAFIFFVELLIRSDKNKDDAATVVCQNTKLESKHH